MSEQPRTTTAWSEANWLAQAQDAIDRRHGPGFAAAGPIAKELNRIAEAACQKGALLARSVELSSTQEERRNAHLSRLTAATLVERAPQDEEPLNEGGRTTREGDCR